MGWVYTNQFDKQMKYGPITPPTMGQRVQSQSAITTLKALSHIVVRHYHGMWKPTW